MDRDIQINTKLVILTMSHGRGFKNWLKMSNSCSPRVMGEDIEIEKGLIIMNESMEMLQILNKFKIISIFFNNKLFIKMLSLNHEK